MAARTLKFKYEAYDEAMTYRRENLSYNKDKATIYYEVSGEAPEADTGAPSAPVAAAAVAAPQPVFAPVAAPSGPAASVPDAPISAELLVHVLVAQKLKKSLGEVPLNKSIKDLSGGKRFTPIFVPWCYFDFLIAVVCRYKKAPFKMRSLEICKRSWENWKSKSRKSFP